MSRRSFGPVVLLGLGSGALCAVASSRPWAQVTDAPEDSLEATAALAGSTDAQMPLAAALSLVVLAAWGVLLVTRGRVRRAAAVIGMLAAAGVVATVVVGYDATRDALAAGFAEVGADEVRTAATGWFWAAAVSSLGSVVAAGLAVRLVSGWPAMGSRYDAPGSAAPAPDPDDAGSGDLWRSIDEGRDPTA